MRLFERIVIAGSLAVLAGTAPGADAVASPSTPHPPTWPAPDWPRASPEAQGLDSNVLADALDEIRRRQIPIHSLTIVRHGHLVLDAYFWPFQDHQLHDTASVTKSVTATLAGVAIAQHRLAGVSQPVTDILGAPRAGPPDARRQRLTVEHLLTMTSGLDCRPEQDEITLRQMRSSADWTGFMRDLPPVAEPGSVFAYCSGGMHLLSGVISQATGASALDFARRTLFAPLGITQAAWPADAQGHSYGWGDLHLQPRDMAKIGYLWLQGGRWRDRQLLPAGWMRAATQVHARTGASPAPGYGYGLWVYPDRAPPIYEALGRGGQRISVVPAEDLVVVFTGGGFEPGDIGPFIARALQAARALPENPAGAARLVASLRAATLPPAAQSVTPAAPLADRVSGRTYALDANPFGIRSLSLTFAGGATAQLQLELGDRLDGPRPVGLDGVPRVSPAGRFGLPVAVLGAWEADGSFVLDYDEVGNINHRRFRLRFLDGGATVALTEGSEQEAAAAVRGRARDNR